MVEFCEKCGGMMLPLKKEGENVLSCNLCDNFKPISKEIVDSYKFIKEIIHSPGQEFKNLKKIENWKEKRLYKKFRE
jgi:DNA-directed RNA polymerase subunit M/transcription elongation factor TFIIS